MAVAKRQGRSEDQSEDFCLKDYFSLFYLPNRTLISSYFDTTLIPSLENNLSREQG